MLQIAINGQLHRFQERLTILDALRFVKIEIPTLCYDERMKPLGGCRLCIVKANGSPHPVIACSTQISDGMVIETHTHEIEQLRRSLLQLLAHRYPADFVREFPDKEFHRLIRAYGLEEECTGKTSPELIDESNPYIRVDMSQCIYCYRCVRICEEMQGQFVWKIWNRGDAVRILPDSETNLRESSCVSCGACVDTCPTGALEDKSVLSLGAASNWTRTTCAYCGTGCEMNVGTREGQIVVIRPVQDAPVSRGHLCSKGRYAFDFVHAQDRVTHPMIRVNGSWQPASWDEAISFAAGALGRIVARHGSASVGVLGSARATNEENYLAQKFARTVLETNNVDCCARVCHAPTAAAMKLMLGAGAATNSFDDIERARTILICGANPTENHPILGARIKQAALNGTRLIVIDPRKIELTRYAALHLQLRPGMNIPLLNAIACAILEEDIQDEEFLNERVSQFQEFRHFIQEWTPERAALLCGVEARKIREAAHIYAREKPAMCIHGLGVTEHIQGTEGVMCLVNLALLTGNIGKPGTGINPLRGQNNVQGAAHMGCDPGTLTGSIPIKEGSDLFATVWQRPIPTQQGLNLLEMMDAAEEGHFKALWAIGYDIFLTNADAHATRRALSRLELVIVQDMFMNETAKEFGSIFLPAASSFEKTGTFMNAERRIQRVRKAIEPVGGSRPDWEIICDLARAMGKGDLFSFRSPEEIWNEIRSVWKAGAGINYERMEYGGLQWPCPAEDHPGTQILHKTTFSTGTQAALRLVDYKVPEESADDEYPFILNTGRTLYQFNAGTMTARTPNSLLCGGDFLDISTQDAQRLELFESELVRVRSRYGEAVLPIRITDSVAPGELFASFHTPHVFLNFLTGPHRDKFVDTPEYKLTAVRIERYSGL
ncbi:formate dehydrogenase subunit alpha [Edaphobacter paludis]|uniref:Formate dehydrogenase subunit alpha n=1 Tax=Edaphobacter paludis TaxID=3035702 RepID=A0AAU7DAF9_9BACT